MMIKKTSLLPLLMGSALFLGGCDVDSITAQAQENIQGLMDGHEYVEIPWDLLMLEQDKETLTPKTLPHVPALNLDGKDATALLSDAQNLIKETTIIVNDTERYVDSGDNRAFFDPLTSLYKNKEASTVFVSILSDVYQKDYHYPSDMDVIGIGERAKADGTETLIYTEWKIEQDTMDYSVYPITFIFDDNMAYVASTTSEPHETLFYQRPLTLDSHLDEQSHQNFLLVWQDVIRGFNQRDTYQEANHDHLSSLATETISLSLLQDIFLATKGDLNKAVLTEWHAHDNEGVAETRYTFAVPQYDDDNLVFTITYSRLLGEITGIETP